MSAFDNRLINLTIQVEDQTFTFDESYAIVAGGARFTNGNFGECSFRLDNISKNTRDFIITKTTLWRPSPPTPTPAIVTLNVGRESYGTFQMFKGNAVASSPTQPPDIGLVMHSLTQQALLGYINTFAAPPVSDVQAIAQKIADLGNLTLDFQAKNPPQVFNYHFTGPLGKQIEALNQFGVIAFIDSGSNALVVLDDNMPRVAATIEINADTGMVGTPEITEVGVRVRVLIKNEVQIMSPVRLTSKNNPAVNGDYYIYQLMFEVASRDVPFYWIMELRPQQNSLAQG